NDLYVRFFRMAERRIVEKTGKGIVCFISNYSWLDGLSFTGMRERYLEVFDKIWIDCLNGDKYKTGKLTPDGKPDPSVFSTEHNREGIQVGTAIALLTRKEGHQAAKEVSAAQFWGVEKRKELAELATSDASADYVRISPKAALGLPLVAGTATEDYSLWPPLPELLPFFSPGVKTSRDLDLVAIDRDQVEQRIAAYFDQNLSDAEAATVAPGLMEHTSGLDPIPTRRYLQARGIESGEFLRYAYRPFDQRWVYWHSLTKLLDRNRAELRCDLKPGNLHLACRQKAERSREGTPFLAVDVLPDWHLTRPGSICFPMFTSRDSSGGPTTGSTRPNLSAAAQHYLADLDCAGDAFNLIWLHVLAIGTSEQYLAENADGIRQDWPRIPLPNSKELLLASAELGRKVADLLDPETDVDGVTAGVIRPEMKVIGVATRVGGGNLDPQAGDLAVSAGWGHAGQGGVTMPGRGKAITRPYAPEERAATEQGAEALGLSAEAALDLLGDQAVDVYLNDVAYWRCVPAGVWSYTIGGYQVMKKWLSYRERALLGRDLKPEEVREVMRMARRIGGILLMEPALDANYLAAKDMAFPWTAGPLP
ncbi:MAG: DNA methyltransferase, partial [Armatimonadetes bacterium]|nr:DNA methyltransferase [Armatimonadota bacterium]